MQSSGGPLLVPDSTGTTLCFLRSRKAIKSLHYIQYHLHFTYKLSLLRKQKRTRGGCVFVLYAGLLRQFQNFGHFCAYTVVVFPTVRPQTLRAVLNSRIGIAKTAAAPVCQCVKRTVAEQTAEGFRVRVFMAGKILTFFVLEKIIVP